MMSAARTPGTHPKQVSKRTISTEPQPLSITANGGKITANNTCKHVIVLLLFDAEIGE